uniref:Putative secreted protein n=1 Tax=Ixodes ricinus TaxID=34613 RepID=A0A6B0TVP3_IXORI
MPLSVWTAIWSAPSLVLLPPMKPLECTNTQPSIPLASDSSLSLRPHHFLGRKTLQSKEPKLGGTPCTLQALFSSS